MIYKSCNLVEHGLTFTWQDIKLCCLTDKPYIIQPNFNIKDFDIDVLIQKKRLLRNQFKNGNILPSCINCHNLVEKDWDNEDYINNLYISHWTKCNCKCIYCYYDGAKDFFQKFKSYNFMKILEELKKRNLFKGDGEIMITGGEPTVLKELDKIIYFCLDNNVKYITLNSSCIDYKSSIAKALSKDKLLYTLSLDCSDREMYKKIKRMDCFDRVIKNLKKYIAAQGKNKHNVRVKYIILPGTNDTIENVEKWICLCNNLGVKLILLDLETNYYLHNKNNIPKHIYTIIEYCEKRAEELDLKIDYYSHILQLKHEDKNLRRGNND